MGFRGILEKYTHDISGVNHIYLFLSFSAWVTINQRPTSFLATWQMLTERTFI